MKSAATQLRPSPLPPVHPPCHPRLIFPANLLLVLLLLLNTHYAHSATAADPSTDSTVQQFGSVSLAAQVRLRTRKPSPLPLVLPPPHHVHPGPCARIARCGAICGCAPLLTPCLLQRPDTIRLNISPSPSLRLSISFLFSLSLSLSLPLPPSLCL